MEGRGPEAALSGPRWLGPHPVVQEVLGGQVTSRDIASPAMGSTKPRFKRGDFCFCSTCRFREYQPGFTHIDVGKIGQPSYLPLP